MASTILQLNDDLVKAKHRLLKLSPDSLDDDETQFLDVDMEKVALQKSLVQTRNMALKYRDDLLDETERCARLTAKLHEALRRKEETALTISQYQQHIDSLVAKIGNQAKLGVESQIANRYNTVQAALTQLEKPTSKHVDREAKKGVVISVLQAELQKETDLNQMLQSTIDELQEHMKSLANEMKELRRENESLSKALEEEVHRVQKLELNRRKDLRSVQALEKNCSRLEEDMRQMLEHHARCTSQKRF
eukprot:TRINITY_DN12963_c0_g1_i1.p1 TRINITY_DN12963_c0_g1~~TRINITY_DN12963_c0_g1_i1.p1  ORF type:complete len:263 (+),score=72.52 TRINITY_DN12963_c0_g1_i1:45-791(+)